MAPAIPLLRLFRRIFSLSVLFVFCQFNSIILNQKPNLVCMYFVPRIANWSKNRQPTSPNGWYVLLCRREMLSIGFDAFRFLCTKIHLWTPQKCKQKPHDHLRSDAWYLWVRNFVQSNIYGFAMENLSSDSTYHLGTISSNLCAAIQGALFSFAITIFDYLLPNTFH